MIILTKILITGRIKKSFEIINENLDELIKPKPEDIIK